MDNETPGWRLYIDDEPEAREISSAKINNNNYYCYYYYYYTFSTTAAAAATSLYGIYSTLFTIDQYSSKKEYKKEKKNNQNTKISKKNNILIIRQIKNAALLLKTRLKQTSWTKLKYIYTRITIGALELCCHLTHSTTGWADPLKVSRKTLNIAEAEFMPVVKQYL